MRPIWKSTLALLAGVALLSGCGLNQSRVNGAGSGPGSGASAEDQSEVTAQLAQNPDLIDEAVFSTEVSAEIDGGAIGGMPGGPRPGPGPAPGDSMRRPPLRFWRHITGVERAFEFAYADTDSAGRPRSAIVTVKKTLTGTFDVLPLSTDPTARPAVVRKPLVDHWIRRLALQRVPVPESDRPQWRVVGTSGVRITAEAAETRIASVRLETSAHDTTITDPLALFRLRRVLRFEPEDSVTITVSTSRNDDIVVLQLRDRHVPLRNNGDGTYAARLRTGMLRGVHHLGVDALAKATLADPEARYDSQAWILPFVVAPTELADAGRP